MSNVQYLISYVEVIIFLHLRNWKLIIEHCYVLLSRTPKVS